MQAFQAINQIKDALENQNYLPLKITCYICKHKNHLALRCPKFPRWRGNLMRLFARQKGKGDKSPFKPQDGKPDTAQNSQFVLPNMLAENEQVFTDYFVQDEETYDNFHYPSAEEEELVQMKSQLIRSYVKERDEDLDGLLLENIFENPAETMKHLELLEIERKRQVFQHLVQDQQNETQIGYAPNSIQSIIGVKRRQGYSSLGFTERSRSLSSHVGMFRGLPNEGSQSPKGQAPNFGREFNHNLRSHKSEIGNKKHGDTPKDMGNTRLDKIEEEKEFISHDSLEASCSISDSDSRKPKLGKGLISKGEDRFRNDAQLEEQKIPNDSVRGQPDLKSHKGLS